MSLLANLLRYEKIERSRRRFYSVVAAYRGNEKTATAQSGWPHWFKAFLHDLLLNARLKHASGSKNPLGDAVEEMYRFEKQAQGIFETVSAAIRKSPTFKSSFEQGQTSAQQTVNNNGTIHPLRSSLQSSVELPEKLSPVQQDIFQYLLRASDQVAENINKFRSEPLDYPLQRISISSSLDRDVWGQTKQDGRMIDIAGKILKERKNDRDKKRARLAQTLGHEISGHSLLRSAKQDTSFELDDGLEEFIAESNSIYSLRLAAQLAAEEGKNELSELFTRAADELIGHTKYYAKPEQDVGPKDQYIANALDRQLRAVQFAKDKERLARYFGHHVFYDDNPPAKVFGSRLDDLISATPDAPHGAWTLEGIQITPELVKAYLRYLRRLNKVGTKVFSPKEKKRSVP